MPEKHYVRRVARSLALTAVALAVVGCSASQPVVSQEPVDV